jgi:hypothetical protein
MIHHVDYKTHKAVYEVFPGARFARQAAIEQASVNFR